MRQALEMALEALQKIYIAPEHEEYIRVWWPACEQAITAIKEALAQPEQEPVAWYIREKDSATTDGCWAEKNLAICEPLYTTPPQRKPLTDEQIDNIWHNSNPTNFESRSFARAIEAAHGIKE